MNGKRWSVGIGLFFLLSGACQAANFLGQGVIRFHGSIVESGCTSRMGVSSMFEFNDCPTKVSDNSVSVRRVEPVSSVSAIEPSGGHVKLLVGRSQDGRFYNQQYELVDGGGKPLGSGAYVVTLTSP
jgi:hypothetical protein